MFRIAAIIPALDEERHIGHVVRTLPGLVDHVVVVDDASTDSTAAVGRRAIAIRSRGVGAAIATGYVGR